VDTYFRYIIRLDNHIALQDMLNNSSFFDGIKPGENYNHPDKHTTKNPPKHLSKHTQHIYNHKIKYKNKKYANLIDFLLYLSIENDKPSTKCKNILIDYVKK
jgi:hypothetical protein